MVGLPEAGQVDMRGSFGFGVTRGAMVAGLKLQGRLKVVPLPGFGLELSLFRIEGFQKSAPGLACWKMLHALPSFWSWKASALCCFALSEKTTTRMLLCYTHRV